MVPLVLNKSMKRKTVSANIWASNEHPLSIGTFLPLLHVLSFSSKQIRKLSQYLTRYQLPKESFPLSARVPLFMTMEATFNFKNLKFSAPALTLFEIDEVVENERRRNFQKNLTARGTLNLGTTEDIDKR